MIDVKPFEESDLKDFSPRGIYSNEVGQIILNNKDPKMTITANGKVLSIVGATHIFDAVAEIWTVTVSEEELRPHIKEYVRMLRIAIDSYMERSRLRRLQIVVPSTFPTAKKWGKILGFELEGTLKNFGWDCTDYYMFARYK